MSSLTDSITPRLAGASAMAASAALALQGVLQLTDDQSSESTTVGLEHVTLGAFSIALVALIPIVLHLGRLSGRFGAAALTSAGLGALGLLSVVSNVRGEDPSFFAAVAAPSNLVWLAGLVVVAVALLRSGRIARPVALGLPLTWLFMIPLSLAGGGLVAGAYWLAVGWMVRNEALTGSSFALAPAR